MAAQNLSNNIRKVSAGETSDNTGTKKPAMKIPNRYLIRETGSEKCLSCIEAPNVAVYIKSGLSISAAAVSKADPGTIYLDGVARIGPILDHSRQVYNFDHHEGCVLNQIQQIIDRLRLKEVRIKKDGQWEQTDFLEYTAGILSEIDQIVYESKKMGKLFGVEELARVNRRTTVLRWCYKWFFGTCHGLLQQVAGQG